MKRRLSDAEEDKKIITDREPNAWDCVFDFCPNEILDVIFASFTDIERRYIRLTCKTLFFFINYTNFEFSLPSDSEIQKRIERLSQYTQPISIKLDRLNIATRYDSRRREIDATQICTLTNLTSLSFGCLKVNYSEALSVLTNLYELEIRDMNITALNRLTNLTSLRSPIFSHFLKLDLQLPNLERLEWILATPASSMPKLTRIYADSKSLPPPEKIAHIRHIFVEESNTRLVSTEHYYSTLDTLVSDIYFKNLPVATLTKLVYRRYSNGLPLSPDLFRNLSGLTNLQQLSIKNADIFANVSLTALIKLKEIDGLNGTEDLRQLPTTLTSLFVNFDRSRFEEEEELAVQSDPKEFTRFERLRKFTVQLAKSSDLPDLTKMTKLRSLHLFAREWSDTLEDLPYLNRLTELKIGTKRKAADDRVQRPFSCCILPMTSLTNLKILSIIGNMKCQDLPSVTKLKKINIQWMWDKTFWNDMIRLPNLEAIELKYFEEEEELLEQLTALQHLTSLIIDSVGSDFTGRVLTQLTQLRELKIDSHDIEATTIAAISRNFVNPTASIKFGAKRIKE